MVRTEIVPTSRGEPEIHLQLSPETAEVLKRVVDEKVEELRAPENQVRYSVEFMQQLAALATGLAAMAEALQVRPQGEVEYPKAPE